jgi:hypothetical protein
MPKKKKSSEAVPAAAAPPSKLDLMGRLASQASLTLMTAIVWMPHHNKDYPILVFCRIFRIAWGRCGNCCWV